MQDKIRAVNDSNLTGAEKLMALQKLHAEDEIFKGRMRAHGFIGTGYFAQPFDSANFQPAPDHVGNKIID